MAIQTEDLGPLTAIGSWELLGSHELELDDQARVADFRNTFTICRQAGVQVLDVESRMHQANNPTKSINQQLAKDIYTRADEKLYVSPEYQWLAGAGLSDFHVLRSSRAETSAHQVFFGVLHNKDNPKMGLPLAVKPCTDKDITAVQDWLNGHLSGMQGERHFKPVGFMLHNGRGYSLTELERGVDTLDNSEWSQVLLDEKNPAYAGQRELLVGIAQGLARLHRKNVFHHDPQFKNIALDVSGEMYFIDWESAAFYDTEPPFTQLKHKVEHDLKVLFGSMARSAEDQGVGLLHIFNYPIQWQHFKKYIFNPYVETYLGDQDETSQAFSVIGDVEQTLQQYVEQGEIYQSLKRRRTNHG